MNSMKSKTLLEKAMSINTKVPQKKTKNREEQEIAVAYLRGHVSLSQIQKVTGINSTTGVYAFVVMAMRSFFETNDIQFDKKI